MLGIVYENCMSTDQLTSWGRTDGPNFRLKKKASEWDWEHGIGFDLDVRACVRACVCMWEKQRPKKRLGLVGKCCAWLVK